MRYFASLLIQNDRRSAEFLTFIRGTVEYTAVIFCAYLDAVKCDVSTTSSTREIQLCAGPATQ